MTLPLPHPLDERNSLRTVTGPTIYGIYGDQFEITRYNNSLPSYPCIDICSNCSNGRTIHISGPRSEIHMLVLVRMHYIQL